MEKCQLIYSSTVMVLVTRWDNKLLILNLTNLTKSSQKSTECLENPPITQWWWSDLRLLLLSWTSVFDRDSSSRLNLDQDRPSLTTLLKAPTLIKDSLNKVRLLTANSTFSLFLIPLPKAVSSQRISTLLKILQTSAKWLFSTSPTRFATTTTTGTTQLRSLPHACSLTRSLASVPKWVLFPATLICTSYLSIYEDFLQSYV